MRGHAAIKANSSGAAASRRTVGAVVGAGTPNREVVVRVKDIAEARQQLDGVVERHGHVVLEEEELLRPGSVGGGDGRGGVLRDNGGGVEVVLCNRSGAAGRAAKSTPRAPAIEPHPKNRSHDPRRRTRD